MNFWPALQPSNGQQAAVRKMPNGAGRSRTTSPAIVTFPAVAALSAPSASGSLMHTRSARNKETGQFHVEVTDWNGRQFAEGWFSELQKAEAFGAEQERRMTLKMMAGPAPLTLDEILMTDDELMAALKA